MIDVYLLAYEQGARSTSECQAININPNILGQQTGRLLPADAAGNSNSRDLRLQ